MENKLKEFYVVAIQKYHEPHYNEFYVFENKNEANDFLSKLYYIFKEKDSVWYDDYVKRNSWYLYNDSKHYEGFVIKYYAEPSINKDNTFIGMFIDTTKTQIFKLTNTFEDAVDFVDEKMKTTHKAIKIDNFNAKGSKKNNDFYNTEINYDNGDELYGCVYKPAYYENHKKVKLPNTINEFSIYITDDEYERNILSLTLNKLITEDEHLKQFSIYEISNNKISFWGDFTLDEISKFKDKFNEVCLTIQENE